MHDVPGAPVPGLYRCTNCTFPVKLSGGEPFPEWCVSCGRRAGWRIQDSEHPEIVEWRLVGIRREDL